MTVAIFSPGTIVQSRSPPSPPLSAPGNHGGELHPMPMTDPAALPAPPPAAQASGGGEGLKDLAQTSHNQPELTHPR